MEEVEIDKKKIKGGTMKNSMLVLLALMAVTFLVSGEVFARGNKPGPVIYVESQGLFYDAVIAADPLPNKGPFQHLYECNVEGRAGLCTEFGPGDFGFYGGRWYVDLNEDGMPTDGDHFFSCPLLGPGREME